ncbi:MAG TPA: hypothetical protein VKI65_18490 [Gemmataceae bacterium]|nr:hypothetical protein [Gemmataceae bacterium]
MAYETATPDPSTFNRGEMMPSRLRAIAFDLDAASLSSLREALPEWKIEVVNGATAASLTRDWNPGAADLLVVKALEDVAETLKLCRFLVSRGIVSTAAGEEVAKTQGQPTDRQDQARRAGAPLLVLVPSKHGPFVKAALAAGADSCLVLPAHAKEMATMLARVRQGNQPGRHTLNLDRAQSEDSWRDDGGQG